MSNDNSNLVEQALSDRLKLLHKSIEDTLNLINERETIKKDVLSGLENEILKARNIILERTPQIQYKHPSNDPMILDCQREIFRLDEAIINENIDSWKDILQLKRELIHLMNESVSLRNKLMLLKNNNHET
jgi:hypothetical protein